MSREVIVVPLERDGEQFTQCSHGVTFGVECPECQKFSEVIVDAICRWDSCRANMAAGKRQRKAKSQEQEELDLKNQVDNAPD